MGAGGAGIFYLKKIRGKNSLFTWYIKEVEKMCTKCTERRGIDNDSRTGTSISK